MKRTVTIRLAVASLLALGLTLGAVAAMASPLANSAVILTRIFNDDSDSNVQTFDNYPVQVWIDDSVLNGDGFGNEFANLHIWRLSTDDLTPAVFNNGDGFSLAATVVLNGTGNGEAGLNVSPWWSQNSDGRFNIRTPDGEIACFGGRLPFYSFTGSQALSYVKDTPIRMEVIYRPNGLSAVSPATIEYKLNYNSNSYTSGELAFDMGNPAEDPPHGLWGMLNDARVGGYIQPRIVVGDPNNQVRATWSDIVYVPSAPTPTVNSTWGTIKKLYR
jgi:hypothetical protein